MASTGIDYGAKPSSIVDARGSPSSEKNAPLYDSERRASIRSANDQVAVSYDSTHRKLKPRHIQLIGIGGTIGTALYVQIGRPLIQGGPGSLFIAYTIWCGFVLCVTLCMAEMATYLPISSPFIRFAGRFVDEAFGFAAGWNFFVFQAALVPFEIVACNLIIHFWSDAVHAGVIITIVIALYALINLMAVKWYGETEFWAALGKVLLIVGLIIFTFIAMLGGNPLRDRFGFRFWRDPGAFTSPSQFSYTGDTGRWLGFFQCLIQAAFAIAGPDYVSMAAGEAENPREIMPRAYKAVFYRLTAFFVLGSLCVGILVPYNNAEMIQAFETGEPGAAASPYVVAMNRLQIKVLPHIVNAMVLASAFSAGNSYVYCASRSLFGLALEGKAPKFLTTCNRNGVPYYSVGVVLLIALLSFLQLSENSAVVLSWFVSLVTASQLLNFSVMCFTFLRFKKACEAQGLDRNTLPFRALFQPYIAYIGLAGTLTMAIVGGYAVFLPGQWDVPTFLFSYFMIAAFPVLYIVWKVIHKTKFRAPSEVDLYKDVAEIEEYQRTYVPEPPKNTLDKWFNKIFS